MLGREEDKKLALAIIAERSRERGWLGLFFGSRDYAASNTLAMSVLLLFVLIAIVLFMPLEEGFQKQVVLSSLVSDFTFVVGLSVGQKTRKDDSQGESLGLRLHPVDEAVEVVRPDKEKP